MEVAVMEVTDTAADMVGRTVATTVRVTGLATASGAGAYRWLLVNTGA